MSRDSQPNKEYDADKEFGAAIKALQDAAFRLRLASYAVDVDVDYSPSGATGIIGAKRTHVPSEYDRGAVVAAGELLAAQIDAIGTQVRKVRKRSRII